MAFVDQRLLLSSEVCLNYVTINADTYMSVYNASSNYYKIYKSTNGGPVTAIKTGNPSETRAPYIWKIGTTLYTGYYVNNLNSFTVYRYTGSTNWVQDGYLNEAEEVICHREHGGNVYFLFTGFYLGVGDGQTIIAQFGTGAYNNFTVVKQTNTRLMRAFDIHPTTGLFYIADQDPGIGVGNVTIYSKDGATEETLLDFTGSSFEALDLSFVATTLYLLRTSGGSLVSHVFSKLSDLTTVATEEIIDSTLILNGTAGVNFFRPVRSSTLHDLLIVKYAKANSTYGFFTYNTTDLALDILTDYSGSLPNHDRFGSLTIEDDNVITGVGGKYISLYHAAPDDPTPPPPDPEPIEELTEELLIEVREAPCNPITLCWLNSLGSWETYCFEDVNGVFETELKTRIEAEYERYVEDLETDTNSTGITTKTVERSLKLGADNIDTDIYVGLLDLFTSPAAFMLVNEEPITWQSVRVSPGSIQYSEYEHSLELTLELPGLFIQRS